MGDLERHADELRGLLRERSVVCASGCHEWTGAKSRNGYGQIQRRALCKSAIYTHRLAWELKFGPIPSGLLIRHSCDNPCCINVEHLSLGTHRDNSADAVSRGRTYRSCGEKSGKAILTQTQVDDMRARRKRGDQVKDIAAAYQINSGHASRILRGERWPA